MAPISNICIVDKALQKFRMYLNYDVIIAVQFKLQNIQLDSILIKNLITITECRALVFEHFILL